MLPPLVGLSLLTGCRSAGPDRLPREPEQVAMLSLMLPTALKIQPFTKMDSFDADAIPDGMTVVVRPLDTFGDPVKAVGLFYFELWNYREASGDPKGERLEFWEQKLSTRQDVELFWTRAQMYEFRLAWTRGVEGVQPGRRYVLTVTYRTPWDTTLRDEQIVDFQLAPNAVSEAEASATGGS